ncbi:MAG: hypothetical protein IKI50_05270 [Clostridia bacterium]|nr:hypothetical protein [Clostridia bacterium]
MKKRKIIPIIALLVVCIGVCAYAVASYIMKTKAEAVISDDYATITYKDKVYNNYPVGDGENLPAFSNEIINATVDKRLFLWDGFLTDYIFVSEDGQFLHLITDDDVHISDYYKAET